METCHSNPLHRHILVRVLLGLRSDRSQPTFKWIYALSGIPVAGVVVEGVYILPGTTVGALEHYGNLALAVASPLVFFFVYKAAGNLAQFLESAEEYTIRERFESRTSSLSKLKARYLRGDPHRWFLWLCVIVGLAFASWNAWNATQPVEVWQHDVYDSLRYPWAYAAQRLFFFVWWCCLLPILFYRTASLLWAVIEFFTAVKETNALDLQPSHPDGAGGLGMLGTVALNLDMAALFGISVAYALFVTHGSNNPLLLGMLVLIGTVPVAFFFPLFFPHIAMKENKRMLEEALSKQYKGLDKRLQKALYKDTGVFLDELDSVCDTEEKVRQISQVIKRLPTWPFDTRAISAFIASIVIPFAVMLLKELLLQS